MKRGRGRHQYDEHRAGDDALSNLNAGDVLLVAGKGHEDYQILPIVTVSGDAVLGNDRRPLTHKIPFSDSGVVRELAHSLQLVGKKEAILTAA